MADESPEQIRQEMTLKADQVFTTLERLNSEFTRFGEVTEKAITRVGSSIDQLKKIDTLHINPQIIASLNGIAESAQRAAAALNKVGLKNTNASVTATKELNQQTNNWLLSAETIGRVLQTQVLIRGLNTARDIVQSSYTDYLQFSKRVSELHAVDRSRSFDTIASSLVQESNQFNQPIDKVAEGQYQAVSNQFVSPKQQSDIMSAANDLAKTSFQDLGKAVELVSGSLNAYGEGSERAALRAAQFDQVIASGHMRMEDLGTALARVLPMGRELGVSMEEAEAALVALSLGGLKASESATQLRGLEAEMLKPTEAMKVALKSMNMESAAAGIATYGFGGFIARLTKAVGGSNEAMAQLFPNMRANNGEFRLGASGAKVYAEALETINKVTPSTLSGKVGEINETPAEKATRELNKLSNFFKTDFGADLVKGMSVVTKAVDPLLFALPSITSALPALAVGLGISGAAFLAYSYQVRAANAALIENQLLAQGKAGIGTSMAGNVGMMAVKGLLLYEELQVGAKLVQHAMERTTYGGKQAEAALAAEELLGKKREEITELQIQDRNKFFENERQHMLQRVSGARAEYAPQMEQVRTAAKVEEEVTKQSFAHIIEARRKLANDIRGISEAATKKADEPLQEKLDANKYARDMLARSERDATVPLSVDDQQRRVQEAQNTASELLANAKDNYQEKVAGISQQHADAELKKYESMVKESGTANDINSLENLRWQILNKQNEALEKQQAMQRSIAKEAGDKAILTSAHNLELETLKDDAIEAMKTTATDEKGTHYKSNEQYKAGQELARQKIDLFNATMKKYQGDGTVVSSDPNAFKAIQRENDRTMAGADMQRVNTAPDRIAANHEQLQKIVMEIRNRVPELIIDENISAKNLMVYSITSVVEGAESAKRGQYADAQHTADLRDSLEHNKESFGNLYGQLDGKGLGKNWLESFGSGLNWSSFGALGGHSPSGEGTDTREVVDHLNDIMQHLGDHSKQEISGYAETMASKVPESESNTVAMLLTTVTEAKNAFDKLAAQEAAMNENTSAVNANTNALLSKPTSRAFGGMLYRDAGGDARGTDTIPAMLSPGEMVMNAASSRKFAAQLIAMNAGSQPIYRQEGGSVTNVGDVSITVQESKTPQATSRELMAAFRREIRRGSATL